MQLVSRWSCLALDLSDLPASSWTRTHAHARTPSPTHLLSLANRFSARNISPHTKKLPSSTVEHRSLASPPPPLLLPKGQGSRGGNGRIRSGNRRCCSRLPFYSWPSPPRTKKTSTAARASDVVSAHLSRRGWSLCSPRLGNWSILDVDTVAVVARHGGSELGHRQYISN